MCAIFVDIIGLKKYASLQAIVYGPGAISSQQFVCFSHILDKLEKSVISFLKELQVNTHRRRTSYFFLSGK